MTVTAKTIKALRILDVPYGSELTARSFAEKMWPLSDGWKHVKNTGNGACSGKGMWLSAGGYLSKLIKKKLVYRSGDGFRITPKGKDLLNGI